MKQIRFGDLVRNSGRPHTLTLWTAPEKNTELQKAIRSNRVLTVHRPNVGTKRDFGTVGFLPGGEAIFLIFPRRLEVDKGQRVIGINYALLEEAVPSDPAPAKKPQASSARPKSSRQNDAYAS
jgi:hypothetical protein